MKTCLLCATEHDDDAATCVACGEATWSDGGAPAPDSSLDDAASDTSAATPRARKAKR